MVYVNLLKSNQSTVHTILQALTKLSIPVFEKMYVLELVNLSFFYHNDMQPRETILSQKIRLDY